MLGNRWDLAVHDRIAYLPHAEQYRELHHLEEDEFLHDTSRPGDIAATAPSPRMDIGAERCPSAGATGELPPPRSLADPHVDLKP